MPASVTMVTPAVQLLKVSLVPISMNAKLVTITAVPTLTVKTTQDLSLVPAPLVSVVMVLHASTLTNATKMLHATPLLPIASIPKVHSLVNVTPVTKVQVLVTTALTSMNVLL